VTRGTYIAVVGLLLVASPHPGNALQAGQAETDVVEAVWAVVGDSAILKTEVDAYLLRLSADGMAIPDDPAELKLLRERALEQLINETLILQSAAADSTLQISDEELEGRVQDEVDSKVREFGTLGQLQAVLERQGMTLASFREQQKQQINRGLLVQSYLAKQGRNASAMAVSEQELRDFFDENRARIPSRPPTIVFEQFFMQPVPSDTARASTLAEAERVLQLVREGGNFAELAKRFSQGPSSEVGGDLDWIRRDGTLVKNFEDAVFSMPAGGVSTPVETEFGFHLIAVERIRGGERHVRHILFTPTITQANITANGVRAEEAAALLRTDQAVADTSMMKIDTLNLQIAQLPQLSEAHATALQTAQPGDVVGPFPFQQSSITALAVIKVLSRRAGGPATFEDMREQLESTLGQNKMLEQVVQGLRNAAYVDIRLPGGG